MPSGPTERPLARWKSETLPQPEWWDLYLKRLEPSPEAVRKRLSALGMTPADGQNTVVGWWSSPLQWAIVTVSKGVYHVSEFARSSGFPLEVTEPLSASNAKFTKPVQGNLF